MSWKLRFLISAMLLAPPAALALGLGEIRLGSALNEPLSAEIDLVAATPDELSTLQAQLASGELFQRYGLDRPGFLETLEFHVGRGQDGRSVLLVRSREAISEPFVSFLVDVSWPRGRLLREYTVLLDPPVFTPASEGPAAAPIVMPSTEAAPARQPPPPAATAEQPAPVATEVEPAPAAVAVEPAPAPTPAAASRISREAPSAYRVNRGDTLYEISRSLTDGSRGATQRMAIALFRANPEAFNGNINVLRAGAILRVPTSDEVAAISRAEAAAEISRQVSAWRSSSGAAEKGQLRLVTPEQAAPETGVAESAPQAAPQSQVAALERDIEQQRRLLELKNQELAELQREIARAKAAEETVATENAAPATTEAAVAPEDDTGAAREQARPPVVAAEPKPKAAPVVAEKSFFDSLTENWLFLLGAAALLLAGGLGYGFVRRRREADIDEALKGFDIPASAPVPSETMRLRSLATGGGAAAAGPESDQDFIVEERPALHARPEAARPVSHDETISTEAALDLDQADPLAEADFHMAYGLYDQAADLVKMALQHSPERNDLKLKLAEIHFVAGNTTQFLAVARDLRKSIGSGADWDRIVIMGRQLAPDDVMFAGGTQPASSVDLSLEGGDSRVDLDLLSTPGGDEGLDLDLGRVRSASDSSVSGGETTELEFNLDEVAPISGTTQEMEKLKSPSTVEMPTIELPSSDLPTLESPAIRGRGGDTVVERFSGRGPAVGLSADSTAEMAIDDLGLDIHEFEGAPASSDVTVETPRPDATARIAAGDERTRLMPPAAGSDEDGTAIMPGPDSDSTAMLPALDAGGAAKIDLDVGAAETGGDAEPTATQRLPADPMLQLSELEPVTMSEVGTKLDLARAYMDMGDPDGARSILQEVLAEGSASQKQEARRLIDTLPGV